MYFSQAIYIFFQVGKSIVISVIIPIIFHAVVSNSLNQGNQGTVYLIPTNQGTVYLIPTIRSAIIVQNQAVLALLAVVSFSENGTAHFRDLKCHVSPG